MSKQTLYFRTFYSFTQSGPRVYVYGSRAFTKEVYLRAAHDTLTSVVCMRSQMRWDGNWEGACGDGDGNGGEGGGRKERGGNGETWGGEGELERGQRLVG